MLEGFAVGIGCVGASVACVAVFVATIAAVFGPRK